MLLATAVYATSFAYHEGTWQLWIVLAAVVGAANGCTMTLGPSLSADVIDSDELETGRRREGTFMGIWSFMDKAAIGLAIFVGMQGLEAIGYLPNQDQSETVVFGIKILYCIVPAVCHLVAVVIFQRFPITAEVHAGIRAQLDARRGAEATDRAWDTPAGTAQHRPDESPRSGRGDGPLEERLQGGIVARHGKLGTLAHHLV